MPRNRTNASKSSQDMKRRRHPPRRPKLSTWDIIIVAAAVSVGLVVFLSRLLMRLSIP